MQIRHRLSNAVRRGPDRIIALKEATTSALARVCATYPPYGRSALEPIAAYLELEKLTHDCSIGRQSFQQPQQAASASRRCVLVTQEFRPSLPSW